MATPIQVVLQEDVEFLGTSGDVVKVRPGHARNFLIPRGLAVPATASNLGRVEELKAKAAVKAAEAKKEALALKAQLEKVSVKLSRQVGAENKMYGSVTNRDIEEAYATTHGLSIDRKKLNLAEAIRSLGLHEVQVKIHPDVSATLRVEVVIEA